ncbi:TlpA disulfide reductase family protein [uncultured Abyssibacter sp.]|uniref:TlpA family protein disulfide reductase n=1 Tax=uncultured Abyssibacter sp. TaxID=2320202 RepID=UPI0032B1A4CC|tara:strand:+ start:25 stop:525 length:501 start_codon:yes stop_codon:yes gene_type:complete
MPPRSATRRFTRPLRLWLALCACLLVGTATAGPEQTMSIDDFSLDDHTGEVIYLDFWASWCEPCKASFRWMSAMQHKYADHGLRVVAVNVDNDEAAARRFLRENESRFLVVLDPDGRMAERYALMGMPSSYLLGRDGEVRLSHRGFLERDTPVLESQIRAALNAAE